MSQEKNHGEKHETIDEDQKKTGLITRNRPILGGASLWDCLTLLGVLAVPLILGIATIRLSNQQADLAQQQHDTDQRIANQQRDDQQQAALLQTYLDNIQDLLIHNNLQKSKLGDEVALLARERTLTALQRFDSQRKGVLVQFIYEHNLIGYSDPFGQNIHPPIIILFGANLIGTNLAGADLKGADLIETDLSGANLARADLSEAVLGEAHLSEAHLRDAHLNDTLQLHLLPHHS